MRQPKPRDKRLYWRGAKLWCRVPGPSGRIVRVATRCTDEIAASAVADELERRYADPAHAAAAAATLGGAVKALLADMTRRSRSAATHEIARQKLGHFVRIWGEPLSMAALQADAPARVLAYIDQRRGEGAADFTITKELAHLKMALAIARYLGVFSRPDDEIFPPFRLRGHTPRSRKPSQDEVALVCLELDPARAAHIAWMAGTGSRRSEAAAACREDARLDDGYVHIRGTKTIGADDDVPLTPISRPWVEAALAHAPGGERGLLFAPWGNLSRDLAAACKRAGVVRITPNDFRRAFGSWHRDAGVSAELVSKLLRHTTDKLAQTTYAKLQAPALGELVSRALSGVPDLYSGDVQNGVNGTQQDDAIMKNAEKTGATRGNRTLDLRFTKPGEEGRSNRIKTGMSRALAEASVPTVYAHAVSSEEGSDELATLRSESPYVSDGLGKRSATDFDAPIRVDDSGVTVELSDEPPGPLTDLRLALAALHGDVDGRVLRGAP